MKQKRKGRILRPAPFPRMRPATSTPATAAFPCCSSLSPRHSCGGSFPISCREDARHGEACQGHNKTGGSIGGVVIAAINGSGGYQDRNPQQQPSHPAIFGESADHC